MARPAMNSAPSTDSEKLEPNRPVVRISRNPLINQQDSWPVIGYVVRYLQFPLNLWELSLHLTRMGLCTRQSVATEKGQQPRHGAQQLYASECDG
jgi:hypothetical protein